MEDLLDEVRSASRAIGDLADPAGEAWPKVSAALSAILNDVERRLTLTELNVLVLGSLSTGVRLLIDAAVGEALLPADQPSEGVALVVRTSIVPRYVAYLADGTSVDLATKPIEEVVAPPIEIKDASVPARLRVAFAVAMAFVARVLRLERWMRGFFPALPEAPSEARARKRRDVLSLELADLERTGVFQRKVTEIVLEHPCALLPPGLALVVGPRSQTDPRKSVWLRMRDNLGGCIAIVASANDPPPRELGLDPIVPNRVVGLSPGAGERAMAARLRAELPALFQQIRRESPTVVGALAVRDVRDRLESLAVGGAKAESACKERLREAERARPPELAQFRQARAESMVPLAEQATFRAVARAKEALSLQIDALDAERTSAIEACSNRAELDACLAAMEADAPARLARVTESAMDDVAAEMGKAVETLQTWLQDELVATYGDLGSSEDAAPLVVTDLSGPSLAEEGKPLSSARQAFERKRVGLGLGGVAAGAALGTLILPGIGTAVGAVVGVLAGLVEGTDALKRKSIDAVRAQLHAMRDELFARLDRGLATLAEDMRVTLVETLDGALARRHRAVAARIARQDQVIERERSRLVELSKMRAALGEQHAHFAALAETMARAVRELAATRAREVS